MNTTTNTITFDQVKASITAAISNDQKLKGTWQSAGALAAAYYGDEATLVNAKAQFIVDAILPALGKGALATMARNLPRKGTPAGLAYGEELLAEHDKAKRDVRATAHTYFTRVVTYAFPKDAVVAEPLDLKTKLNQQITALIKSLQKADGAPFDVAAVIKHLAAAQTAVNK